MANPGNYDPFPYQPQPGEETHLGTPLVQPGQPQGAPPSFAQPPGAEQPPADAQQAGQAPQGPGTPPPFAPGAPFAEQPAAPQPFAPAFAEQPGTPPPFAPQPGAQQPFAPQPGTPQPFAQQPPGTPPPFAPYGAGAGFPPQHPGAPAPFGQGGFPAPPPPGPRRGVNPLVVIGAVTAVLVVVVAALAIGLPGGKKKKRDVTPDVAIPSLSVPPIPDVTVPPVEVPTLPADGTPKKQVPDVLTASVKTAYGTTYRRAGTESGKCAAIAPKSLRKTLTKNSCIGGFKGAVYSSPKKDAVVTVVIMPVKSASAAAAVKRAGQYPYLISPKKGSGVKSIGDKRVYTWSQIYTEGNFVVFSMAYRSDLAKKDKGNAANDASAQLGTELTNVLRFN